MRRPSERGEALVEFALASGLFFMTLFGTISGGLSVYRYNMLASIAQQGARYASVGGLRASSTMQGKYGTAALLLAALRNEYPSVPITSLTTQSLSSGSFVTREPNLVDTGSPVRVTVTSNWLPFGGRYVGWSAFQITATSEMKVTR